MQTAHQQHKERECDFLEFNTSENYTIFTTTGTGRAHMRGFQMFIVSLRNATSEYANIRTDVVEP